MILKIISNQVRLVGVVLMKLKLANQVCQVIFECGSISSSDPGLNRKTFSMDLNVAEVLSHYLLTVAQKLVMKEQSVSKKPHIKGGCHIRQIFLIVMVWVVSFWLFADCSIVP